MNDEMNGPYNPPIDKKAELAIKAYEHYVRFVALANAGGIATTVAVIGALAKDGKDISILAVPLAFFSTGVACALMMNIWVLFQSVKWITGRMPEMEPPFQWWPKFVEVVDRVADAGTFVCFVVGCLSGVILVLIH